MSGFSSVKLLSPLGSTRCSLDGKSLRTAHTEGVGSGGPSLRAEWPQSPFGILLQGRFE